MTINQETCSMEQRLSIVRLLMSMSMGAHRDITDQLSITYRSNSGG